MVKVLQILGGLNRGGAETMIMNLYRRIDREKIQFDFVIHTTDKGAYEDEIINLGGKVYRFPTIHIKNFKTIIKLWDDFFEIHPEYKILHSHIRSYASIYLPIAKKHGVITIVHSHSVSNGKGFRAFIKFFLQIPLRWQADYLFACSNEAGQWLYGKNVVKKNNYKIIKNAIDTQKFAYDEHCRIEMRKLLCCTEQLVIGTVGRLTRAKNHTFLINIFAEIHKINDKAVLLIIGDGELRKELEIQVQKLKLQSSVIFLGSRANIFKYYQAMDIFVFPSLWEGLGLAAVEAQCAGLPVVISERIPQEVSIDKNLTNVINLNLGEVKWAEYILNIHMNERKNNAETIKKAGYDIENNAAIMQEFYLNLKGR